MHKISYRTSYILYIFIIVSIFLAPLLSTHAGLVPECPEKILSNGTRSQVCGMCELEVLVQNILRYIWDITALLAGLMLMYGGTLMLLAASPSSHEKGKKVLWTAVIGIAIIFFGWLGIDTIMKMVAYTGGKGQTYGPWNEIQCSDTKSKAGQVQPPTTEDELPDLEAPLPPTSDELPDLEAPLPPAPKPMGVWCRSKDPSTLSWDCVPQCDASINTVGAPCPLP